MVLWMLIFLTIAVWNDWRSFRIPNSLVVIGAVVTMAVCFWKGLPLSYMVSGAVLPFVICFPLFILGCLGGGDIKLLMVCGIPLGRWVLYLILWSFLWNGVYAVYFLWKHKGFRLRFQKFSEYISLCVSTRHMKPYISGDDSSHRNQLHFSFGIFLAYMTLLIGGVL